MFAIFLKEIRSYFKSFFGWIFLAVFTFFASVYFIANNIIYGYPYISYTVNGLVTILSFVLPLLTMRIIAEEKKQKTDQFLITSPVPLWKVIAGKFLSLVAIMLASVLIVAVGAIVRSFYGEIPVFETILALGLFFLFGCTCVAIGMFLSSITEHQILAALFTYGVFFFTMLVPSFLIYIFGADTFIGKVMVAINIYGPLDNVSLGILDLKEVFYYISIIFMFLFLSYKIFAKNSVQISASGEKRFFISSMVAPLCIIAVIAANIGISYIPDKYAQYDLTQQRWFSITDESKKILDELDQNVTIYVIEDRDNADVTVVKYLDDYEKYSDKIKVEYVSQKDNPYFYMDYTNTTLSPCSLIVVGEKGQSFCLDYYDLFEFTPNYTTNSYDKTGISVESEVTTAIYSLMNDINSIHVCVVTGHNELPLTTYVQEYLSKAHAQVESLSLVGLEAIPEYCDILIVNGPESDFSKNDVKLIEDYIDAGKDAILVMAPSYAECTNYDSIADFLNIEMTEGTVLERDYTHMMNPQYPFFIISEVNPDSRFYTDNSRIMLLTDSRGFLVDESAISENDTVETILSSSDQAYAKAITQDSVDISYAEGDPTGVYSLALFINRLNEKTGNRSNVVLIGSPAFLYPDYDEVVSYANSELFSALIGSVSDQEFVTVVPSKSFTYENIMVNTSQLIIYIVVGCVLLPLIFIVSGIVIMIMRRRK